MSSSTNQPSSTAKAAGIVGAVLIIGAFVGWVAFYLLVLRPPLLDYIMSSMGWSSMRFPAMLHLIPIIGVPVLLGLALAKIFGTKRPAAQDRDSARV